MNESRSPKNNVAALDDVVEVMTRQLMAKYSHVVKE
jgi:hypothetical protein